MARIMLVDCDLAAMTKITKGTRETRVKEEIAAMIAARREETTDTTVYVTWSQQAIAIDATSEVTTGEATVGTHATTTNAVAPKAPEAIGHPA